MFPLNKVDFSNEKTLLLLDNSTQKIVDKYLLNLLTNREGILTGDILFLFYSKKQHLFFNKAFNIFAELVMFRSLLK